MIPRRAKNRKLIKIGGLALLLTGCVASLPSVAQQAPWTSPKDAEAVKNPVVATAPVLAEAKTIYAANCAPCHGERGRGDGPAAQGLTPKPADHSSAGIQSESDGSLYWKLSEGRTPMPAYKKVFTDQQRWELILYIRTLAKPGKKK